MIFFAFYGCIYSSDFKNFNQCMLKKNRCHPKQIIYKKIKHLCRFWFSICCSFYRTYITLFANRFLGGTYGYAMGAEYTMRCSRHQSAGDAHGANSVSCISQCQIVRLGNRPKSGMVNQ